MGKPKLRPLPVILKLVESLSEDERADLRDYLRPPPKPRQKVRGSGKTAQKRKAGKEAAAVGSTSPDWCRKCSRPLDDNIHQLNTRADYHEFVEPAGEAKGVSA